MFKLIGTVLHDCFTGIDGVSYNPVRIIGYPACVGAVIVFFGNTLMIGITKGTFDGIGFGTGFALIMGALFAVGAAEAVKTNTEPPAGDPPKGEKT